MPNYDEPVSSDTPCLDVYLSGRELKWLKMHIDDIAGCELSLVDRDDAILLEDNSHQAYLVEFHLKCKAPSWKKMRKALTGALCSEDLADIALAELRQMEVISDGR